MRVDPHEDTESVLNLHSDAINEIGCMRVDPHEDTERYNRGQFFNWRFEGCMRVDPHEDTESPIWVIVDEALSLLHEGRSARGY